jgi:outer membrane lipoprotein-sorting protein
MRKALLLSILVMLTAVVAVADTPAAQSKLTAAQIVDKNVAARGGLQAWKSVQTLTMTGKMEAGGNQRPTLPVPGVKHGGPQMPRTRSIDQVQLPFTMDLKRGRKQRIELQFNGQTAVQVYDGTNGWKVRPFLNRNDVEPFTADELKAASGQFDLDGPLVDYAAKGIKVDLVGMEKVDDHDTYKLKLTLKNGDTRNIWIDASTFLETKIEGTPRRLDGKYHPVEIYYKDFRAVNGLTFPHILETKVLPIAGPTRGPVSATPSSVEKIMIENVSVNPKLEDALFTKPQAQGGVNAKQPSKPAAGHSLP